jgi:RNA polymerase sigma factor (sigma-70 family)
MPPGSVSRWIGAMKTGDQAAAGPLWRRYHARLLGLARQMLQSSRRGHADENDVVQNAFNSFFRGVAEGRFTKLDNREDLWRLLVTLTARKAIDQVRRQRRVTFQSRAAISLARDDESVLEEVMAREPTPELAAQIVEQYELLLNRLDDPVLQQIAVWKLEGFTNGEIAGKLACSRRTVIRKLETIRLIWSKEPEP